MLSAGARLESARSQTVRIPSIFAGAQSLLSESPTIAAVLAIIFAAVNDQPPSTTLGIPQDFVRTLMESIGLGAREPGLNAMISRLKRYARDAEAQKA